jgi:hypothetical protein
MLPFWNESPISWLHGPSLKQRSTTSRLPYSDLHCIWQRMEWVTFRDVWTNDLVPSCPSAADL